MDVTGISKLQPTARQFPDELESAIDLVSIAGGIRDVNQILGSDKSLREQLTNSSADLLVAASYDRGEYLSWVAGGEREAKN